MPLLLPLRAGKSHNDQLSCEHRASGTWGATSPSVPLQLALPSQQEDVSPQAAVCGTQAGEALPCAHETALLVPLPGSQKLTVVF